MTKKIEAFIRKSLLEEVKSGLIHAGVEGMTVSDANGWGREKGSTLFYRGAARTIDFVPRVKIEIIAEDDQVEDIIDAILQNAQTGQAGDGRISVAELDRVIRVRSGNTTTAVAKPAEPQLAARPPLRFDAAPNLGVHQAAT